MKTAALIALVGAASSATAQDIQLLIEEVSSGNWDITAEFTGDLPGASTAITAVWADASVRLTGDSAITFGTGWNPGFESLVFGAPVISNDGSNSVEWVGVQPGSGLGTPDSSNPLFVDDFTYAGNAANLTVELFGQNTASFAGDPANPFGTILTYGGDLTVGVEIRPIPAPASAALLGLGGLAAARRRR